MAACIRGRRRCKDVGRSETDGAYQLTLNGGSWRSTMVVCSRIRLRARERRIGRLLAGARRDSALCSAVAEFPAGMNDWTLMASTGPPRTTVQPLCLSITSAKVDKLSIGTERAR